METMVSEEKKALELAIAHLDRQYGKGIIVRLGDESVTPWPSISTGALTLDLALGIGGLPIGRIVEIYGPESSGKTTIALSVIAEAQRQGMDCLFVDVEHALDPVYAQALGVNLNDLYVSQPDYGEAALEIIENIVQTGDVRVIVLDSVAALVPKAELDGDMSDNHVGLQPRLMAKAMRKLAGPVMKNQVLVIFINQLREKIGIMFGNPETQPGGRALKFQSSVRIDVRKKENLKTPDGEFSGIKVVAKVVKNKMSPPFRQAEFDILYGHGVDRFGCLLDAGISRKVLRQSGAWFYYGDKQLGQGRPKAVEHLRENTELSEDIKELILNNG